MIFNQSDWLEHGLYLLSVETIHEPIETIHEQMETTVFLAQLNHNLQ